MPAQEKDFHVESSTGAILTKFWPGGHKPAYLPLTHFVVAAKSASGVVLTRAEGGDCWNLPGGTLTGKESVLDEASEKFRQQTGLGTAITAVLGYFRIVWPGRVEYGALVVGISDDSAAREAPEFPVDIHVWDFNADLNGLDPIGVALAGAAAESLAWHGQ